MIEKDSIWRWTILESSGRWSRAVCRYVVATVPVNVLLQVDIVPLVEATASSLIDVEACQQVILWELDSCASATWSVEQTLRVQGELRQLKHLAPQIKQLVAIGLDQVWQTPMWYEAGADAVLSHFSSLGPLAQRVKVGQTSGLLLRP